MNKKFRLVLSLIFLAILWVDSPNSYAQKPAPRILDGRDRWVNENFEPIREIAAIKMDSPKPQSGLIILANHDSVLKNSRAGNPLKLGDVEFTHGLLCHAISKVIVRLPEPGKAFTAVIGVDNNPATQNCGSVLFSVQVGDQDAYQSEVIHGGGQPGIPINIDLAGANTFVLTVSDAGDGIACDHGEWADAKITLMNGQEIWLDELPIISFPSLLPDRLAARPPFSFIYNHTSSDQLLGAWKFQETKKRQDENRTQRTQVYTDPETGLEVRCVAITYNDYPVVEWTLYFKNTGKADTPILENIQTLDTVFPKAAQGDFLLHYLRGDTCSANSFEPLEKVLKANDPFRLVPAGGRPTNFSFPYFNIETGDGGVIAVIGWPGQWAANFEELADKGLRVAGGQELTRFTLLPGEEVRSPLIVLMFWQDGDWINAQNLWRRWMVAHNIPRPGGKLVPTHYGACWSNDLQPRAETELAIMNGFIREKIDLDFWFIDAGWYPDGGNWPYTGTWVIDTDQFPNGIRPVSDHARANGMQFVLWFEPERVAGGTWLTENHPEWILGGKNGGLVNLGNPEAWNWVVERFDSLIVSEGVDVYRQDFNMDPLDYWRGNDTVNRQGITEIGHVTGYLAYWDELLRRHPNLWIDTCASGGRRNDLETLRRSVPLLRSDAFGDPITQQCQTYGLSFWVPYFGSGLGASSTYWFRSCIFPASRVGWDTRNTELDYPLLRRMIAEFRKVQPYLLGDFYPLTPYSLQNNAWIAWQYDQPELDGGMIQAFRREECTEESKLLKLGGLDATATYLLEDLDTGRTEKRTGQELTENGLQIVLKDIPGAALFTYHRIK